MIKVIGIKRKNTTKEFSILMNRSEHMMIIILVLFGLCATSSCQHSSHTSYIRSSNPVHVPYSNSQHNLPSGSDGVIPSPHPIGAGGYPGDRNGRVQYQSGWSQNQNPRNQNPSRRGQSSDLGYTPLTPPYQLLLKEFDDAFAVVKKKIEIPNPYSNRVYVNEPYITILNAVNLLIDATLKSDYNQVYWPTILQAIRETRNDTIGTADSVRVRLDKTASQIALLRDVINDVQENVCNSPDNELTCDQLIDSAVYRSQDNLLQQEAGFLAALSRETNAFMTRFIAEFDNVRSVENARQYLYFGKDRLKDLIEDGARARRIGNGLQRSLSGTGGSSSSEVRD